MELQKIYQILDLEPIKVYTQQELRTAFIKASLRMHPDKGGSNEQFRQLRQAYQLAQEKLVNKNLDMIDDMMLCSPSAIEVVIFDI